MEHNKSHSEKFVMINAYIKKKLRSQINNLTLYIKKLEKITKPKVEKNYYFSEVRR